MKSSQSEFLSWRKGRNKHNLNYHSRRIVACCSGIKQASRQVADLKHRQTLPKNQLPHPGEVELPLAKDQPLFLHPGHHTGHEPPTAPAGRKLSQLQREPGSQADTKLLPTIKAKPFSSKQIQLQCSFCCSGTAMVGTRDSAGMGRPAAQLLWRGTAAPSRWLLSPLSCPGQGSSPGHGDLRASILLQGFYSTFTVVVKCHAKLKSPEQKVAFLSVASGRGDKRRCRCHSALLRTSMLCPYTQAA